MRTQSSTAIAGAATDFACGQRRRYREPHPPALRYRNTARQRHHRCSAPCCWTLRVSVDRAARPSPHTRGKPWLLDVGRRILARDGFAPDSPLEETVRCELVSAVGPDSRPD